MKILVVEDDRVVRKLLETELGWWGYETIGASDGVEALELIDQHDPPIVVSDWLMPRMDGLELARRIRARPNRVGRGDYIYIILVTARTDTEDLVAAMEAGADDFLSKPVEPEELRVRVRAGERVVRLERELSEHNRALRDAQAALVQTEKLASLGHLAAGVAHEINNPLAYVINSIAVLRRDTPEIVDALRSALAEPPAGELADVLLELPRHLDRCADGLGRVRDIVRNMLDFARLDEAEVKEADINAALRSTLTMLQSELRSKRITLDSDFGDVPPLVCSPGKLNQVFLNLLMNAIQASDEQAAIDVRTRHEGKEILVEVADAGTGIAPDVLPHIFDPFFTTKPVGHGTGLGLSVSYRIVTEHGGSIEVDSDQGRGSTFRVRLPLR